MENQSIAATTIAEACAYHAQVLKEQHAQVLAARLEHERQVLLDAEVKKTREQNERMAREAESVAVAAWRKKDQASRAPLNRDESAFVDKFMGKLVAQVLASRDQVDAILKQRRKQLGPIPVKRWCLTYGRASYHDRWLTPWESKYDLYRDAIDLDTDITWGKLYRHLSSHDEMRWLVRDQHHPLFGVVFMFGAYTDNLVVPSCTEFKTGVALLAMADNPPYTSAQAASIISIPRMKNEKPNGVLLY